MKHITVIICISWAFIIGNSICIQGQSNSNDSLLISLLKDQVRELEEKKTEQEELVKLLEADTLKLSKQIRNLEKENESTKKLKQDRSLLTKRADSLRNELTSLNDRYQNDSSALHKIKEEKELLREELTSKQTGFIELKKQLDSLNTVLSSEMEQHNRVKEALNVKNTSFIEAEEKIAVLNTQIEQLIVDKCIADSALRAMNAMFEPLVRKAESCENQYQKIKAITQYEELKIDTINTFIQNLELLDDLLPQQNYSRYLIEVKELRQDIIFIDSAYRLLNRPFDNEKITAVLRNLAKVNSKSAVYNKAKDARGLLNQYRTKLEIFNLLLESIKSIDRDYNSYNNSTYNKKHLDEIEKYVNREKIEVEAIPFLKRKIEELLAIKKNNVHEDVSQILKKE